MKGYKIFNSDFKCRDHQFSENSEHKFDGEINICNSGFHFCLKASDCFSYYDFKRENIVCEVEALGETKTHDEDSKICTNLLKVGKRLTWEEVLFLANEGTDNTGHSNSGDSNSGYWNSGDWNSGYRNSGNGNSGYRNSGDWNSGYRNSGNWNSGDWNSGDGNSGNRNSGYSNSGDWNSGNRNSGDGNSGDRNSGDSNSGNWNSGNWNSGNWNSGDSNSGYRNSGAFCTEENPTVFLFDVQTSMKVREWENHKAYKIMSEFLHFNIWVPMSIMTNQEKLDHPKFETTEGYLKNIPFKQGWSDMWNNLSDENKNAFLSLPNFDAKKFEHITGINVVISKND